MLPEKPLKSRGLLNYCIMASFSELKKRNLLSSESMSSIRGGRMALQNGTGTCGFKTLTGTVGCGVSKAVALFMIEEGGYWCCDSCGSSSYCG